MWIMIIIAVHTTNPQDIPGRVTLEFGTQRQCQETLATLTSWIKFNQFRIEAQCQPKPS